MDLSRITVLLLTMLAISGCGSNGNDSGESGSGSSRSAANTVINGCDAKEVKAQTQNAFVYSVDDYDGEAYPVVQEILLDGAQELVQQGDLLLVSSASADSELRVIRSQDFCTIDTLGDVSVPPNSMYFTADGKLNVDHGGVGIYQYTVDQIDASATCLIDNATCNSFSESDIPGTACVASEDAQPEIVVEDAFCVDAEGDVIASATCVLDDLNSLNFEARYRTYYSSLDSEITEGILFQASLSEGVAVSRLEQISDDPSATATVLDVCGGQARALDRKGNILFVAARGSGLYIVDVENKTKPKIITKYNPGTDYIVDVAVWENQLFAMGFSSLHIFDIANASAPSLEAVIEIDESLGINDSITANEGHVIVSIDGGALLMYKVGDTPDQSTLIPFNSAPKKAVYTDGAVFVTTDSGISKLSN